MGNLTHTVSGDIANFRSAARVPIESLKCHFKPKQDLHGYDNPWPAGGGKNLFNINSVEQNPDNISYSNETKRIFTPNTYFSGSSYSNYWNPPKISSYSIQQNGITVDSSGGYGVGFAVAVTEGNYYLSWVLSGEGYASITLYKTDGTAVIISNGGSNPSFTIPNDVNIIVITFRNKTSGAPATFTDIQLEKGSSATSYEPYENICPIEGWNGIIAGKASKNLLDVTLNDRSSYTATNGTVSTNYVGSGNGTRVWFSQIFSAGTYTISCDYSGEGTNGPRLLCSQFISNSTWNNSYQGYWKNFSGRSCTFTTEKPFSVGLVFISRAEHNGEPGVLYNIQLELGSSATDYEPYNGSTIPVTFPATKNLFNEQYEGIRSQLTYHNLYVGNETVTASTSTPQSVTEGYSNIFVFPGQVTTGANTTVNDICVGRTRTITPVDGYITIAYRNGYGVDPRNYHTQIERGTTATAYEPYGTLYGGYVDIAKGELVATHAAITFDGSLDESWDKSGDSYSWSQECFCIPWSTIGRMSTNPFIYNRCISDSAITSSSDTCDPTEVNSIHVSYYHYSNVRFHAPLGANATVSDLRAYLAEHPLTIINPYVLTTSRPVYQLTPIQVKTFLDQNNIWSNTNDITEVSYYVHDSNMIRNLKRSAIQHTPKLQYWLSGNDAPVNGSWIERVQGLEFKLCNGADWDSVNKRYNFDTPSKGAYLVGGSNTNNFYFGHHWQFDFDIWINKYLTRDSTVFFDIGSVTSADKALGFGIDTTSGNGKISLNWKLNGNNSNPFSGHDNSHPSYPLASTDEYVHVIGSYKMVDGGDGYDRLIVKVNGVTVKFNDIQIPQATYGPTWQTSGLTVGTSVYNYNKLSSNTTYSSYSPCCYIKDIKIYILD